MMNNRTLLIRIASIVAVAWCALPAVAHTPVLEGLVRDKPMVLPIQVKAAYNDTTMFFRIQWVGDRGDTHDYYRYDGAQGKWVPEGAPRREAQSTLDNDPRRGPTNRTSTNYESRVAFVINDKDPKSINHIPGFAKSGCFVTCHDDCRAMPEWDPATEKTKYLKPGLEGKKLDMWHHRLGRANPIGRSDDFYVATADGDAGGRHGDSKGSGAVKHGPWENNWDSAAGHPKWVFDPGDPANAAGAYALRWGPTLHESPLRFLRDPSAPNEGQYPVPKSMTWDAAVAAGYSPRDGDTVPRRVLFQATGSRGDISAVGSRFTPDAGPQDPPHGTIVSITQRALATGHDDDVQLEDGKVYDIAFAVHTGQVTVRDHYVSFAHELRLGADSKYSDALKAVKLAGDAKPNWDRIAPEKVDLFLPGIASLEFLDGTNDKEGKEYFKYGDASTPINQDHDGFAELRSKRCQDCHNVTAADNATKEGSSMEKAVLLRGGVLDPTPIPLEKSEAAEPGAYFTRHRCVLRRRPGRSKSGESGRIRRCR